MNIRNLSLDNLAQILSYLPPKDLGEIIPTIDTYINGITKVKRPADWLWEEKLKRHFPWAHKQVIENNAKQQNNQDIHWKELFWKSYDKDAECIQKSIQSILDESFRIPFGRPFGKSLDLDKNEIKERVSKAARIIKKMFSYATEGHYDAFKKMLSLFSLPSAYYTSSLRLQLLLYTKNSNNETLLHCIQANDYFSNTMLNEIYNKIIEPYFLIRGKGTLHAEYTPLQWAILCRQPESVLKDLIKNENNKEMIVESLCLAASMGNCTAISVICNANKDDGIINSSANEDDDMVNSSDKHGMKPIHYAAKGGHIDAIKLLLYHQANIKLTDNAGKNTLLYAVENASIDTIQFLLKDAIQVDPNTANEDKLKVFYNFYNAVTRYNETVFDHAVVRGDFAIFQLLINNQNTDKTLLNVKHRFDEKTLLHYAMEYADDPVEMIKLLLEHKADVNVIDKDNGTPLHLAIKLGHIEIVKLLLANKADVNVFSNESTAPLYLAIQHGNKNINITKSIEMIKLLLANKADVNTVLKYGYTSLYYAISYDIQIVRLLLANKANVDIVDNDGYTLLHLLVLVNQYGNKNTKAIIDMGDLLLENKLNVNAVANNGETPLHCATLYGHIEIVKLLLDNKANVNAVNNDGETPLHCAIRLGDIEKINLLLKHANETNLFSSIEKINLLLENANETNLHTVMIQNRIIQAYRDHSIIQLLNTHRILSFQHAVQDGNVKEVLQFIANKGDFNIKDDEGNTVLHLAACNGKAETVDILLKHGADIHAQNRKGDTPLDMVINRHLFNLTLPQGEQAKVIALLISASLQERKIKKFATTHFENKNNQRFFLEEVRVVLQKTNQPLTSACEHAYRERTKQLIDETANILPLNEQEVFIKQANKRLKKPIQGTFEKEVVGRTYDQIILNRVLSQHKKSVPANFQAQFVNIAKANILKLDHWEQNEEKWKDTISDTTNLIKEKYRFVQFLTNEYNRIKNDLTGFMNDPTKTQNKLDVIKEYILLLKSDEKNALIDSIEKLNQIKNILLTLKDFTGSRNRFFTRESDAAQHLESNFTRKMGI